MCGICGAWGKGSGDAVRAMLPKLRHRGPDGIGYWDWKDLALGHTRLSIVDLSSAGHQPMHHPDGTLTTVVNGEIYNYRDLRRRLQKHGAVFRSRSDSEVVLHAYRQWGRKGFAELNGMFAFALWDASEELLLIVRDRIGIKPLYYTFRDACVSFASELKALIPVQKDTSWRLDVSAFSQYLTYQNSFGGRTLLCDVHSVEPGEIIAITRNGVTREKVTAVQHRCSDSALKFGDAVDAYSECFIGAVGRHLMSDVPVACYLSAGFDSTSVATVAKQYLQEPPDCYTGSFNRSGWYDETSVAKEVAKVNGMGHQRVEISYIDAISALDDVVYSLDEPKMGMGALPQYLVARRAAQLYKVILTGHGGDELFSGYPVFKLGLFLDQIAGRQHGGSRATRGIRLSEIPHLAYFLARQLGPPEGHYFLPVLLSTKEQQKALVPRLADRMKEEQPWVYLDVNYRGSSNDVSEQIFYTYLRSYLQGLLMVEDKISMAHSLEARTPFLDNEMLDLAERISPPVKLQGGDLKAVVKEAGKQWLPHTLYKQPKRGFPVPFRHWLRGPIKNIASDRLTDPNTRLTALFRHEWLVTQWHRFLGSASRHVRPLDEIMSHRMWQLLCLESWLRQCEKKWGVRIDCD